MVERTEKGCLGCAEGKVPERKRSCCSKATSRPTFSTRRPQDAGKVFPPRNKQKTAMLQSFSFFF